MVNLRELTQRPGNSIPGYTGFVPGKKAETIIAGTYARINHECAGRRYPLGEPLITSRSLPGGSRPIHDPRGFAVQPSSVIGCAAGDVVEGRMPSTEQLRDPCNRPGNLDYKAISGYKGYVPGKQSENVYGSTFTATSKRAAIALNLGEHSRTHRPRPRSFWDSQGSLAKKLTKDGTWVPARENDVGQEIHLFGNAYNDFVRGGDISHRARGAAARPDIFSYASVDECTGRQILPAGVEKPFGRRDTFNRHCPPQPLRATGWTGTISGKVGENIIGTREHRTQQIASQLREKNRIRITNV